MYNLIKCSNCNASLGEKYELYILMKNYLYEKNEIEIKDITKYYCFKTDVLGKEILNKEKISLNTSYLSCFKTLTKIQGSISKSYSKKKTKSKDEKEKETSNVIERVLKRRNYIIENLKKIEKPEHKELLDFGKI